METIKTILNGNYFRYSIYPSETETSQYAIFLLGALQDIESVDTYSRHFSKTLNCITIEVPGTGCTDPIDSTISIRTQTQMLLDLIEHLKLKSAHVIGFSYATAISIELCDIWQGVLSLSICGGVPGIPKSGRHATKQMIAASMIGPREFAQSFTESLTVVNENIPRNRAIIKATKRNIEKMPQSRIDIFFENSVRLLVHTPSNLNISVPSTICVGEFDPYVTKETAEEFASNLKNSNFIIVNNADHLIHLQYPEKVAEILIAQSRASVQLSRTLSLLN